MSSSNEALGLHLEMELETCIRRDDIQQDKKDVSRVKCLYCDQVLPVEIGMDKHIQEVHVMEDQVPETSKSIACQRDSAGLVDNSYWDRLMSEKRHKCPMCLKTYSKSSNLKKHMQTHVGKRPYKCSWGLCSSSYIYSGDLTKHRHEHTGDKPFRCHSCERSFSMSNHLVNHQKLHTPEKVTDKTSCLRSEIPRSNVNQDDNTTGLSEPTNVGEKINTKRKTIRCHPCSLCSRTYTKSSALKKHMQIHRNERPYICTWNHCNSSFVYSDLLTRHMRKHTGERPFKCPKCERSFSRSDKLAVHKRLHSQDRVTDTSNFGHETPGSKENQQDYDRDLPKPTNIGGRKNVMGKTQIRSHPYSECSKTYTKSSHLGAHIRTHTGEQPYRCTVEDCDKTFTCPDKLKKHMRQHYGDKLLMCDYCERSFSRSDKLAAHQKLHPQDQVNDTKSSLSNEHSRSITNQHDINRGFSKPTNVGVIKSLTGKTRRRRHQCYECSVAFTKSASLKRHMQTHNGERPYKCKWGQCILSFTRSDNLKKHMDNQHGNKPFKCNKCERSFTRSYHLVQHQQKRHYKP